MDYKRVYTEIVTKRQQVPLSEDEYGEWHHIIPRSIGGPDTEGNLVRLSAREHYICHALLAEMYEYESYEWYKMNHAFMMMKCSSENQSRYYNARLHEIKRKDFSKVMQQAQSGKKNSQYGKVWMYHLIKEVSKKVMLSEIETYESRGWMQGRVLDFEKHKNKLIPKHKYYFPTGLRINKQRREACQRYFKLDLYVTEERDELYELLYTEYVIDNRSTTYLAKKYNCTDPTIRKLLIDFGIGTKDKGGKWSK